ncbi:ergothioneine biosynthesis glutamate--cysteine ligase EgtA [Parafrankia discariae]|uniref:ergothioneine biosynthesis glutamate--cysteine ligase EgtA n=1 Tax=Parafrankia discariae TaxID=365528 RepID=UPI0003686A38|nr:ergothioneine biosynthesis glutamate--cysteine ligase EgtA [Parafrankia discariae]
MAPATAGAPVPGTGTGTATANRVGIETEWFVVDVANPHRPVPADETAAAVAARTGTDSPPQLPGGSRLTFEPGGQLELSGPPLDLTAAVNAMRADLAFVRGALARRRLGLVGMGVDPLRAPVRHTTASRYVAMEQHFLARDCDDGRTMMCSTASVQVNLDVGADATQAVERFRLAHALEPVLIAMFAASPLARGRRISWQSGRQAVWAGLDPSRTGPVLPDPAAPAAAWLAQADQDRPGDALGTPGAPGALDALGALGAPPTGEARLAWLWARYLHDAELMMVGEPDGRYQPVRNRTTFGDWMAGAGPVARPPTAQDLGWHATTLFPPVRPRGWLELRYLDAQPSDLWPVAVAVPAVLLDEPAAARAALAACLPVAGQGRLAAQLGLRDPELGRAAVACVDLALDALTRTGADPGLRAAVEAFANRYTRRGRSPADDLSARFEARGPAELLREEASQCVPVP